MAIPHAHPSPAPSPFPPHCYLPAAAFAGGGGGSVVSVASSSASLSSSPAPRHNNAMGFAGVGGCSPVPVRRQQQQHLQHLQHQAPPQMVNIVPPQAQQVGLKIIKKHGLSQMKILRGGKRNNSFFCGMLGKRLSAGESSDQLRSLGGRGRRRCNALWETSFAASEEAKMLIPPLSIRYAGGISLPRLTIPH